MVARHVLMEPRNVACTEGYSADKRDCRACYLSCSHRPIICRNLKGSWDGPRHCWKYSLDLCFLTLYLGYRPCQMASGPEFRVESEFRAGRAYHSINGFASYGSPKIFYPIILEICDLHKNLYTANILIIFPLIFLFSPSTIPLFNCSCHFLLQITCHVHSS